MTQPTTHHFTATVTPGGKWQWNICSQTLPINVLKLNCKDEKFTKIWFIDSWLIFSFWCNNIPKFRSFTHSLTYPLIHPVRNIWQIPLIQSIWPKHHMCPMQPIQPMFLMQLRYIMRSLFHKTHASHSTNMFNPHVSHATQVWHSTYMSYATYWTDATHVSLIIST